MQPMQSFGALPVVRLLLCMRKRRKSCAGHRIQSGKKMSFIHLFLQCIECLSYIDTVTSLVICFQGESLLQLN